MHIEIISSILLCMIVTAFGVTIWVHCQMYKYWILQLDM